MILETPWFRYSVIAVTSLTVVVWIIMATVTFPNLEAFTGGLKVFDMRPLGYTFDQAKDIVAKLGSAGAFYYISTQQALDSLFPGLLFLTLSGWQIRIAAQLAKIGRKPPMGLMIVCIAINLLGAFADYSENGAVRRMLLDGADALQPDQVASASAMTVTKSFFNTMSYTLLLAFIGFYWFRKRRA